MVVLLPGLARQAAYAAAKRFPPADSVHRIARALPGPSEAVDRVLPEDA